MLLFTGCISITGRVRAVRYDILAKDIERPVEFPHVEYCGVRLRGRYGDDAAVTTLQ